MDKVTSIIGGIILLILAGLYGHGLYLDNQIKYNSVPQLEIVEEHVIVYDTLTVNIINETTTNISNKKEDHFMNIINFFNYWLVIGLCFISMRYSLGLDSDSIIGFILFMLSLLYTVFTILLIIAKLLT